MKHPIDLKKITTPSKTALLVIDVQNDYCSKKGKLAKKRIFDLSPVQTMIKKLVKFIDISRNNNVQIIFIRATEDRQLMKENAKMKSQIFVDPFDLCTPNTFGFDYCIISPEKNDIEIEKNTYDAFTNPALHATLKKKGIENLIITDGYTSICIDSTLRSAFSNGYNIIVPKELVAMPKEKQKWHKTTLEIWNFLFAYVVSSRDIVKSWKSA